MTTIQNPRRGTASSPGLPPKRSATLPKRRELRKSDEPPRRPWRRVAIATAFVLAASGVTGGAVYYRHRLAGPDGLTGGEHAVGKHLPDTLNGLKAAPAGQDFGRVWWAKARAAGDGATVVGRIYGTTAQRRTIRVVVGRTDLTGKLELRWAADAGHPVGTARCTQNFKLTDGAPARIRPTMLLCWRTSPTLSAYSLLIDFDHRPQESDGVTALEAAWSAAG